MENIVTITDTLNVTSALNVAGYISASQGYVTSRGYITSTPGTTLSMNSNSIIFSNNSEGLSWGNNYSQIYDNGNFCINTDAYFSGDVY